MVKRKLVRLYLVFCYLAAFSLVPLIGAPRPLTVYQIAFACLAGLLLCAAVLIRVKCDLKCPHCGNRFIKLKWSLKEEYKCEKCGEKIEYQ